MNLTVLPARKVKPPVIKECIAHLECRLHRQFATEDHTLFIGEAVEAYADRELFKIKYDIKKARMLFNLGGNHFETLEPEIHTSEL